MAGMCLNPLLSAIKPNLPPCCWWREGTVTTAESRHGSSKALRHLHPDFVHLRADTLILLWEELPVVHRKMNSALSNTFCRSWEWAAVCRKICLPWVSGPPLWSRLLVEVSRAVPLLSVPLRLSTTLRVCLEDSAFLHGAAYTCSLSVNNCINFTGSPGLNWLRFMQQTGLMPGPPEQSPVSARWSPNSSQDGRSLQMNVIPPCSYRFVWTLTQWLPNTESARNVNKRHFDLIHLFLLRMYCIILSSLRSEEECFTLAMKCVSLMFNNLRAVLQSTFSATCFWAAYFSLLYRCLDTIGMFHISYIK